jgi:hypothetical protein
MTNNQIFYARFFLGILLLLIIFNTGISYYFKMFSCVMYTVAYIVLAELNE